MAFDRRFNVAVVSAEVLEAAGPNVDGVTSTASSATWPRWRSRMMHLFVHSMSPGYVHKHERLICAALLCPALVRVAVMVAVLIMVTVIVIVHTIICVCVRVVVHLPPH